MMIRIVGLTTTGLLLIAAGAAPKLFAEKPSARARAEKPAALADASHAGKPTHAAAAQIGQDVGKLAFKDIRYLDRSLADFADKKAFVIVCTNTTCPLVQRYLPKLKRLDETYRGRGVQFLSLNVGVGDSVREMAAHALEFDIAFPTVKDIDGQSVAALGVGRTPEAVVLDAKHVLRYRGRIDDQYRLGGTSGGAVHTDLENAIDAVLAGKDVPVALTTVDGCNITRRAPVVRASQATYNRDIAPLLRRHCVECHQPGTEAPFSLLTYEDAKKQGQALADVVGEELMPPWFAAAAHDDFANRRVMPESDRETLIGWVDAGMPRGEGTVDGPAAQIRKVEKDGWLIGKPDLVVRSLTEHAIPNEGYVKYRYEILPYVFLSDTWVDKIQILPDNPKVVHHCNLIAVRPGGDRSDAKFITGKVPGGIPMELKEGTAFRIPKGYALLLQIHFTTNGRPEKCRISVGFRYARGKVHKELHLVEIMNNAFAIPPGDPHYPVTQSATIDRDIIGEGLFSHMHVRGKDMTFRAHYPGGKSETLLVIPNYSFDWQIGYQWPAGRRNFPKGTRFEVVAHYDNSPFNPYNPDPKQTVREGQQTYEEMMYGFFFYTIADENLNLDVSPQNGAVAAAVK